MGLHELNDALQGNVSFLFNSVKGSMRLAQGGFVALINQVFFRFNVVVKTGFGEPEL